MKFPGGGRFSAGSLTRTSLANAARIPSDSRLGAITGEEKCGLKADTKTDTNRVKNRMVGLN
jgi:hypothetical protein